MPIPHDESFCQANNILLNIREIKEVHPFTYKLLKETIAEELDIKSTVSDLDSSLVVIVWV